MIIMSNQIELRHYRYFLAVAETLHFRKAAEKLFISQPGLSRQIKQLEENLGFPLFERTNRSVELTTSGEYLKIELELALNGLKGIIEHAGLIAKGSVGSIRLGYVGSAIQNVIPELMSRFNRIYPSIKFSLHEFGNTRQIEALSAGEIDLGFVRLNKVPINIEVRPVFKETFSLALHKDHWLTKSNFKDLSQLKDESFILFEKSYSDVYFARIMSIFEDHGFSPKISHNTVHANTIFRLIENGFGNSIIPTSLQYGFNMNVKFIELKSIPQRATLSLAWYKENRNPVLLKLLEMTQVKKEIT
jgi:DNA-binding transcriptional LysR family regulator